MHLLVIYDISNDRARSHVARVCEDYGLDRIQFSVFFGALSRNLREELMLKFKEMLDQETGKIMIIPISTDSWTQRLMVDYE